MTLALALTLTVLSGEFHAANNATSLRNPNFFPLRTPYPCLAVRHMVPGDFVFMTLDNYDKSLQRQLLRSFLDVFGKETERKEVDEDMMCDTCHANPEP